MELVTGTALWHGDGEDPLPIRWVLLRDPSGKRSPFALFCTDPTIPMLQLVAWYVSRWNIEVTFLRSPRPSRPGNAAAVEYSGHCTDHSLPVRVVQPRGPHGPCSPPRSFANSASCLVSQSWTHFCRCLGRRPPTSMGATEFANLACCPGFPQFIAASHWHARRGCLLRCL